MTVTSPSIRPKAALLVVDMQEDFCPPNGSLAVPGGRDIAPAINELLTLPFTLKIATKDFHPRNHVSFDVSHSPPHNKAFESSTTIYNLQNPSESIEIPLWPSHCVQGTAGAEIIQEIDAAKIDRVVEKGRNHQVEMFSAFADIFGNKSDAASFDLAAFLKLSEIEQVYVTGLAGDYCVQCTAVDAKKEGFEVFVVEEATKSIDTGENGWEATKKKFCKSDIKIVSMKGPELQSMHL